MPFGELLGALMSTTAISANEDSSSVALVLWQTIRRSYAECFRQFPDVVRAVWLWLLVLLPVMGLADALRWSVAADIHQRLQSGAPETASAHSVIVASGLYTSAVIVLTLAYIDIAVQWHRKIILQQQITCPGLLFLTGAPWRYLGAFLVIALIAVIPPAVALPLAKSDLTLELPIWLDVLLTCLLFCMLAACLIAFVRLCLVLPAQATGNRVFSFLKSWQKTRRNTLKLIVGLCACVMPPGILLLGVLQVFGIERYDDPLEALFANEHFPDARNVDILAMQIHIVVTFFTLPIVVSFLSNIYRELCLRV